MTAVALGSASVGSALPILEKEYDVVADVPSQLVAVTLNQYRVSSEKLAPKSSSCEPCVGRCRYTSIRFRYSVVAGGSALSNTQVKSNGLPALPEAVAVDSTNKSHAPTVVGAATDTVTTGGLSGGASATSCDGVRRTSPGANRTRSAMVRVPHGVTENPGPSAASRLDESAQMQDGDAPSASKECEARMVSQSGSMEGSMARLNRMRMDVTWKSRRMHRVRKRASLKGKMYEKNLPSH